MREIKFRGMMSDNTRWVYGAFVQRNCNGIKRYYIYETDWDETEIDEYDGDGKLPLKHCFIEVYPDTVGQFTGLKDKHEKDIYEGDILRSDEHDIVLLWRVEYATDAGGYIGAFSFEGMGHTLSPIQNHVLEEGVIVGNDYDNPRLVRP